MIKFGTGGWRAIIGEGFTKRNIQTLALAMCLKMESEGVADTGIVIGYDRRFLSKEAVIWASVIFARKGIKVYFVNKSSPTPLLMYYVMNKKLPYGMMITASHNPAIYNGIKVFTEGGRDADEKTTADLERYFKEAMLIYQEKTDEIGNMPPCDYEGFVKSGIIKEFNPLNEYLDNIISVINMSAIRKRELRVAIDPMFGVSLEALTIILSIGRCSVLPINSNHDTLFGGRMPAPSERALRNLQNFVQDRFCDIGIATDGDADRLGVIDDKGRYLHSNEILVLLYYYLLEYKGWRGAAVRNIATTHMLDRVAEAFGEKCYEVPVGFKYISAEMTKRDAIIGGESSGGLTVKGHIHGKDGIYAATLLVEMLAVSGKKLSELSDELFRKYGRFYMLEYAYRFSEERKKEIERILLEEKKLPEFPIEIKNVSYRDGCKVYFVDGSWTIARFSGTEPLIRIFAESESEDLSKEICEILARNLGLL